MSTESDVWYDGHEAGELAERKRIIKLLESLKGTCDGDCDDCRPFAENNARFIDGIVDLINGPEWLDEDIPVQNPREENE